MPSCKLKGRSLSTKSISSKGKIPKKDPKTKINNKMNHLGEEEEHKLQNSKIVQFPIEENLDVPVMSKKVSLKAKQSKAFSFKPKEVGSGLIDAEHESSIGFQTSRNVEINIARVQPSRNNNMSAINTAVLTGRRFLGE